MTPAPEIDDQITATPADEGTWEQATLKWDAAEMLAERLDQPTN